MSINLHLPMHPTKRHPLTGEPLRAVWIRPDGVVKWPVLGGDDTVPPVAPTAPATPPAPAPGGPKPADDKTFTQADVDRIIQGRLSKFADYDTLKQQLADVQAANQSDSEKAINAAKDEGRKEAVGEYAKQVALEAFNGLAGRRNPDYDTAPALNLIDLGKFVKDDGTLDRDALKAAVEQIVPEKDIAKPAPSFGGGARRTADKADTAPGVARLRQAYADTAK